MLRNYPIAARRARRFLYSLVLTVTVVFASAVHSQASAESAGVSVRLETFGAVGDGIADDTLAVQRALARCSNTGATCLVSSGKTFRVSGPLFLWGRARLMGEGSNATISFSVQTSPYLLNLGIAGKRQLRPSFSGTISGMTFKVTGGSGGRIIFFWRTDGAVIVDNVFDVSEFAYSATSSGNDNNWVRNGFANCVRKNASILRNTVRGDGDHHGSEGIGLGHFDGALVEGNTVLGVGDDPIGIHFSKNIRIIGNNLSSVDGRIFVANSTDIEIGNNTAARVSRKKSGQFFKGIALIYVGFESLVRSSDFASSNIHIHHNLVRYDEGAIDDGAAIYIYAPRKTLIEYNTVVNDSATVTANGLHILPAPFSQGWIDPERLDSVRGAKVREVIVRDNKFEGRYPQRAIMTGNCVDYVGPVRIQRNSARGYQFYCPGTVISDGNTQNTQ